MIDSIVRFVLAASLAGLPVHSVFAQDSNVDSGNFWMEYCKPNDLDPALVSMIYGFTSGLKIGASTFGNEIKGYCIPDSVTNGQKALVVCKYLRDNPNHTHEAIFYLIVLAYAESWPCSDAG